MMVAGLALLGAALGGWAPPPVHARGRIVHVAGSDSTGVAGAVVTLHRVATSTQGPVDSVRTGADGTFRFSLPADTAALFLASARFAGIEYFSTPLRARGGVDERHWDVLVFDTASTAPVVIASRRLIIRAPDADGIRRAAELLVLRNPGPRTRVAPDTLRPSWTMPLPPGVSALQAGEGDLSEAAVEQRGDSLAVLAPLPPGERTVFIEYLLPARLARPFKIPLGAGAETLEVFLAEPGGSVPGFTVADTQAIGGVTFRRWTTAVPPASLVLLLEEPATSRRWLLPALVTGVALLLMMGGALAARSRTRTATAIPREPLESLVARAAALGGDDPARAALVQEIATRLAAGERVA